MFAYTDNLPIPLPPHYALEGRQPLAHLHCFRLDNDLFPLGHRTEVRDVEIARHAEELPEPRLADENEGNSGAQVEERCRCAAVQIAQTITVMVEAGEGEGYACRGAGIG